MMFTETGAATHDAVVDGVTPLQATLYAAAEIVVVPTGRRPREKKLPFPALTLNDVVVPVRATVT
jgi:hypothetical protein